MKAVINKLLKPFNVELHGKDYLKKLGNSIPGKDAFLTQQRLVKKANYIFDVGANRGDVTQRYTELYPEAFIHSFEPFEQFHSQFYSRFKQNQHVSLVRKALSDSDSMREFYLNKSADTNSFYKPVKIGASSDKACSNIRKTAVKTETIDLYCRAQGIQKIDILKIDTQGAELAILKGSKTLLEAKRISLIYTEAYFQAQYEGQPLFYEIANYLAEYGYYLEDIYEPYYNQQHLLWCDAIFLPK